MSARFIPRLKHVCGFPMPPGTVQNPHRGLHVLATAQDALGPQKPGLSCLQALHPTKTTPWRILPDRQTVGGGGKYVTEKRT